MVVIYNPLACEGKAVEKWKRINQHVFRPEKKIRLVSIQQISGLNSELKNWIDRENNKVIAAGGDGTINAVVNLLLKNFNERERRKIRLGAIGLGSSNDFHKPLSNRCLLQGIPVTANFRRTMLRDVIRVDYVSADGKKEQRYFIINSSCGITAEANWLFNHPDRFLHSLKKKCTALAILYAAIKTILTYRGMNLEIQFDKGRTVRHPVANLAFIKNPFCSGSFCYDSPAVFDDGRMWLHLCEKMTRVCLLRILWKLSHRRFMREPGTHSWQVKQVAIKGIEPFALEMDGEVVRVKEACLRVIPRALTVCVQ